MRTGCLPRVGHAGTPEPYPNPNPNPNPNHAGIPLTTLGTPESRFSKLDVAIDGADASGLANNVGLGLYDVAGYATFPGFHSMPSDHLACNKTRWDGLSEKNKRIMSVAMHKLGMRTTLAMMVANETAAKELEAEGVTLHNWGEADRSEFRKAARDTWEEWAQKSPAARKIVDSHVSFMTELGLIEPSESN